LKSPDNFRIPGFRHRGLALAPGSVTMTASSARQSAPSRGRAGHHDHSFDPYRRAAFLP
jgi:hypothetical protein